MVFAVVTRNRLRIWRSERKHLMLLDQTIEIFRKEQFKAREHELIHRSRMCNLGLYAGKGGLFGFLVIPQ